jgi:hypothetical protein
MKRYPLFLTQVLIFVLLFTSCSKPPNEVVEKKNPTPSSKITDYYPFTENLRMQYEGEGNEYASKDVYVDFIKNNRIQIRVITGGTTLAQVLENKNGELSLLLSLEEFYYRQDMTTLNTEGGEVLLKEPLEKGSAWVLKDGRKRYISRTDVKISTPSGSYTALEVTTEGNEHKTLDYYVKNIGPVKSIFISGSTTVSSSLKLITPQSPVKQTIKFYYPDFSNERLVFVKKGVSLNTNENIIKIFEDNFKTSPGKDISRLISDNTKINSLRLDRAENKVYVDFSKELVSEMNAGTSMESYIIQGITNTLGDYFNVDKVFISLEGKPYESGHIILTKSDVFYVDYKNAVEYK